MSEKLEAFKIYVRSNPWMREEVRSNRTSWQKLYEEWFFYNDTTKSNGIKQVVSDKKTNVVQNNTIATNNSNKTTSQNDTINEILTQIKKINPDTIIKTLNTAQKVMTLFNGLKSQPAANVDPLFSKYSDDI